MKIEHIPKAGNSIKAQDLQILKNQNSELLATPDTRSIVSFGYDTKDFFKAKLCLKKVASVI